MFRNRTNLSSSSDIKYCLPSSGRHVRSTVPPFSPAGHYVSPAALQTVIAPTEELRAAASGAAAPLPAHPAAPSRKRRKRRPILV